jgi:hypothetical protein
MKTAKTRKEMELAAHERQAKRAQVEHEIALQEREEHIARLRALRLAKDAAGRERAGNTDVAEAEAVAKKSTS